MWYLRPIKEDEPDIVEFYVEKNNDAKANYRALNFARTENGLLDAIENIEAMKEGEE
jgi:hypothetical protein